MALAIHDVAPKVDRVRLFVVTDGVSDMEFLDPLEVDGVEIRRSVWDLARLHRFEASGQRAEPIVIDFAEEFGAPLPCLPVPQSAKDFSAYLAVFPGEVLGEIYNEFGARLLELNVRSFLQATGKVNRGIRDTLVDQPDRFLAYNNGISATASSVELIPSDGGFAIAKLRDLQIVNGGQTTASIHRALRNGVDISRVAVQAKITEIDSDRLQEIVPLISRYANSQNKVSEADLRSNDPFHMEVETRPEPFGLQPRRARATDPMVLRAGTRPVCGRIQPGRGSPARRRTFTDIHPMRQRFTKACSQVRAYLGRSYPTSSAAAPRKTLHVHARARGAARYVGDAPYFQRLVAKAILFRRPERIVSAQNFGGYRANIVTYTLAKLSHATGQRLDLARIWNRQATDDAVDLAIDELLHSVYGLLTRSDRVAAT